VGGSAKAKVKGGAIAQMQVYQCIYCDAACEEEDDKCIECFVCKNWSHQKCAKLTDEVFSTLTDPVFENLQWVCQPCMETKKEVQSRDDARLDALVSLIPMVHAMSARMESLEKGLMGEKLEEKIEEVVDRKLAELWEEQVEMEKRKCNLVIWNLKESAKTEIEEKKKDDLAAVKLLLSKVVELEEGDVVEPVRLGKGTQVGTRPRMLRVTVKSEDKKKEILRKAPELNANVRDQAKRVYINPDYTQKQREQQKKLRDEKKRRTDAGEQNLAIRNGKIVQLKPRAANDGENQGNPGGGGDANAEGDAGKH
jgi:hypothetical protein